MIPTTILIAFAIRLAGQCSAVADFGTMQGFHNNVGLERHVKLREDTPILGAALKINRDM